MSKKNIIIISLILFLTSCGFSPIYYNNKNVNFSIEKVYYTGDREFNNFLKINLDKYKNKEVDNKIFIEAESKYEKNVLTKDSTGKVTSYKLEVQVTFLIKSNNKKIKITEKKIIDSMDDKFEETRREKSVKQSFASSISSKLLTELIIN
tara:strand:+ start:201 stop:650 length:450 start_codon:yes stop_codon:yes gene_type:complete